MIQDNLASSRPTGRFGRAGGDCTHGWKEAVLLLKLTVQERLKARKPDNKKVRWLPTLTKPECQSLRAAHAWCRSLPAMPLYLLPT